jgi:Rrf2 family transcriptional regulator, cysteine metabolism repressor
MQVLKTKRYGCPALVIMWFSKTSIYGIRALAYLARPGLGRFCGPDEIAQQEGIPPVFLRKLLGNLCRHRFLLSARGIHGGYKLAQPAEQITLWEVVRLLESPGTLSSCDMGCHGCPRTDVCNFFGEWEKARQSWLSFLQTQTIADLFCEKHDPRSTNGRSR